MKEYGINMVAAKTVAIIVVFVCLNVILGIIFVRHVCWWETYVYVVMVERRDSELKT